MTTATLNRTPAMLTVTLAANCTQADWEGAMDFVARNAVPGSEGTFLDFGEVNVWTFPAAA
jgi:hypothetical protein